MPATSQGYVINSGKDGWKSYGDGSKVSSQGGSAQNHAERVAWDQISRRDGPVWLIKQDAFPCMDKCHDFFQKEGKKNPIIIKVTADNTYDGNSYVKDGLVAVLANYPHYIYYHNGGSSIASGAPHAPDGFPRHPDPRHV